MFKYFTRSVGVTNSFNAVIVSIYYVEEVTAITVDDDKCVHALPDLYNISFRKIVDAIDSLTTRIKKRLKISSVACLDVLRVTTKLAAYVGNYIIHEGPALPISNCLVSGSEG